MRKMQKKIQVNLQSNLKPMSENSSSTHISKWSEEPSLLWDTYRSKSILEVHNTTNYISVSMEHHLKALESKVVKQITWYHVANPPHLYSQHHLKHFCNQNAHFGCLLQWKPNWWDRCWRKKKIGLFRCPDLGERWTPVPRTILLSWSSLRFL